MLLRIAVVFLVGLVVLVGTGLTHAASSETPDPVMEVPTAPIIARTSVLAKEAPVVRRPWSVEIRADGVAKSCPIDVGTCDAGFGWNAALSLRYQATQYLSVGASLEHLRVEETLRIQDERLSSEQRANTFLATSQVHAFARGVWDPFLRLSIGIARYRTNSNFGRLLEQTAVGGAESWTSEEHSAAAWVPAYRIGLGVDRLLSQHLRLGALLQWHQWLSGPGNACANVVGGVCSRPHAGVFDANNSVWLAGLRLGGSFGTPL